MGATDIPSAVRLWLPAAVAALAVSALVTGGVLAAARRWQVLDRPNARSAHRDPTPTLGGIGVLAGLWCGLALLAGTAGVALEWRALAAGTVALSPLIVDDLRRPLRVSQKLILQLLAAAAWLALGPRLEIVSLPWLGSLPLGWWSWPVTGLWLVGVMNVFNFMDGIDGLTATQTIACGLGLALALAAAQSPAAPLGLLIAAAAAGFLVFNRPPARIFMGDVGAHAIGLVMGGLAVAGQGHGLPFWLAAAILGTYLFDTTYTLARRALRRENVLQAHSQHLYQRLTRRGWSHGRIDALVLALDAGLVAGAILVGEGRPAGYLWLAGAASCLAGGAAWLEHLDRRDRGRAR